MTLDQAIKEIKQKITVVDWDADPDRLAGISPTGEEYLTLCSGGIRKEGDRAPCLSFTEDTAIKTWRLALWEYAEKAPGILYWCHMPEMHDCGQDYKENLIFTDAAVRFGYELPRYFVYSRLIISNKTVVKRYPKQQSA